MYNVQCRVTLCSDGHSQTSIVLATSIHNTCVHVHAHTSTADSPEPSFSGAILCFLYTQRSYIHTCTQERGGGREGESLGTRPAMAIYMYMYMYIHRAVQGEYMYCTCTCTMCTCTCTCTMCMCTCTMCTCTCTMCTCIFVGSY